ncbi:DNA replication/repair protein RecF [Sphingomonas sp.]|uniref:DNA replication/repair protein RecF n=1 Tax=Sphingomonas sp. TaxID=28214 RepID=UPI002DB9B0FD|nr:DNA replication/repair protein RecF [Sphingomonas sp.]HEU4969238.1 DNA replication/repair protein RecF [Sphingomonas sp.]
MIARLSLTDFRSYADALVAPGAGLVILTGENGAGKTNLLEAVSLLAPGRGLRGAALSDMARQGGPGGFTVAARLGDGVEIGTGALASAPERRVVRINGVAAAANALAERLSVLWLTPAMDRLFSESAGGRRRFLDRLVLALEPGHAHHAARYEAAMRARTRLLSGVEPADPAWLAALETQMHEHGLAVAEARGRTVAALAGRIANEPDSIFARAGLALDGWNASAPWPLAANRGRDAAAGRATEGPHRQDLRVTHLGKGQAAERCSTGEQKALLIGLVLAHAALVAERTGRPPVLLLDEVAAHLDPRRRAALLDRLGAGGGQVWMTGTEPALFADAPAGAARFTVENAAIRPA